MLCNSNYKQWWSSVIETAQSINQYCIIVGDVSDNRTGLFADFHLIVNYVLHFLNYVSILAPKSNIWQSFSMQICVKIGLYTN